DGAERHVVHSNPQPMGRLVQSAGSHQRCGPNHEDGVVRPSHPLHRYRRLLTTEGFASDVRGAPAAVTEALASSAALYAGSSSADRTPWARACVIASEKHGGGLTGGSQADSPAT